MMMLLIPTGINSIDYYKFHQKTTGGFALRAVIDHCLKMAHIGKRLQISPFIYIMTVIAVTDFMLGGRVARSYGRTISPVTVSSYHSYFVFPSGFVNSDSGGFVGNSYGHLARQTIPKFYKILVVKIAAHVGRCWCL